jgi:16S rRNA (guanine966-N2)-methyltransferase
MRIIGGEARGRKLAPPKDRATRPLLDRIRESVFSSLEGSFENQRVLDLFAGTGAFGLEAVSRGARRAVFVESGAAALAVLRRNIETLGFGPRTEVIRGDALAVPGTTQGDATGFALVFLDPPFKMFELPAQAARIFGRAADLLGSEVVAPGGLVLLRIPSRYSGARGAPAESERDYGESIILKYVKR